MTIKVRVRVRVIASNFTKSKGYEPAMAIKVRVRDYGLRFLKTQQKKKNGLRFSKTQKKRIRFLKNGIRFFEKRNRRVSLL